MKNEKLLKRIEQTESELAKLKVELNKSELPSWEDLGVLYIETNSGVNTKNYLNHNEKLTILARLLAVADYVNDRSEWDGHSGYYAFYYRISTSDVEYQYLTLSSLCPVKFENAEAAKKALEIFRHNDSKQELINYFK